MKIRVNIATELRTLLPTDPVHYDRDAASIYAYRSEAHDSWIMMAGFFARYSSFVSMDTPDALSYTLNKE